MKRTFIMLLVTASLAVIRTNPMMAGCGLVTSGVNTTSGISSFRLTGVAAGRPVDQQALTNGAELWNACGSVLPSVETSGSGGVPVEVRFMAGQNPGSVTIPGTSTTVPCGEACGCVAVARNSANQVQNAFIFAFEGSSAGQNCVTNGASFVAHELGHVFGLENNDPACSCDGRIMEASVLGGDVSPEDCQAVDALWIVPNEAGHDDDHPCQNQQA